MIQIKFNEGLCVAYLGNHIDSVKFLIEKGAENLDEGLNTAHCKISN